MPFLLGKKVTIQNSGRQPMRSKLRMDDYRRRMLIAGFALFSTRPIESVLMPEVAKRAEVGRATLYRYYSCKPELASAVAEWKISEFYKNIAKNYPKERIENLTAAERFAFYLDAFIELYKNHKDLLRFMQFFNIFMQGEKGKIPELPSYLQTFSMIANRFHENVYLLGQQDGTLRTDIPEAEMFSAMTHIMMSAVTRYALGLVYAPEGSADPEKELELLKKMLIREYCIQ